MASSSSSSTGAGQGGSSSGSAGAGGSSGSAPMGMLCGDEVCALVSDLGHSLCRFGAAGQDTPRHVFRSDIGVKQGDNGKPRYIVGDSALHAVISDMEIQHPRRSNGTLNWEAVEAIMRFGTASALCKDPSEVPIMTTDSLLSTFKEKEEMLELCLESLNCPAFYLAPSSMLSAFSCGRPTALVVEMGTNNTRIRPVIDGYGLHKAYLETRRGGSYLDTVLQHRLENIHVHEPGEAAINLVPIYEAQAKKLHNSPVISSSSPLSLSSSSSSLLALPNVTASYRQMHIRDVVIDLKKWTCFIPYKPLPSESRSSIIGSLNMPPFELPDGTLVHARDNLCTLPEELWFNNNYNSASYHPTNAAGASERKRSRDVLSEPASLWADALPLQDLMYQSLLRCDPDTRRELCANIVICGGGSLIDGLAPRLNYELNLLLPSSIKVKLVPLLPIERLHCAWVGGSILSICGAFQQLWVSKAAYAEAGAANIVRDKFDH